MRRKVKEKLENRESTNIELEAQLAALIAVEQAAVHALSTHDPGRIAEFVAGLVGKANRDSFALDMAEKFDDLTRRLGPKRARRLYRAELAASAVPLLWRAIKKMSGWNRLMRAVHQATKPELE